jgi:hypothetical protein
VELSKLVKERELEFDHVLFATLIGSFADLGMLNQGTTNIAAANVGKVAGEYFDIKGELPKPSDGDPAENFASVVEFINDKMGISPAVDVVKTNGDVDVTIAALKCRYCPKGVGGAELPGTACPFPKFLEEVAKVAMGDKAPTAQLIDGSMLKRTEDTCTIRYSFS